MIAWIIFGKFVGMSTFLQIDTFLVKIRETVGVFQWNWGNWYNPFVEITWIFAFLDQIGPADGLANKWLGELAGFS